MPRQDLNYRLCLLKKSFLLRKGRDIFSSYFRKWFNLIYDYGESLARGGSFSRKFYMKIFFIDAGLPQIYCYFHNVFRSEREKEKISVCVLSAVYNMDLSPPSIHHKTKKSQRNKGEKRQKVVLGKVFATKRE